MSQPNIISFSKTPQAKDDKFTNTGLTEDSVNAIFLSVMGNDLGGNAKSLWSLDDASSAGGNAPVDLLTQDTARTAELSADRSANGATIWITSNGKVGYDITTASETYKNQLQNLPVGDYLTDTFTYAIRLGNGTLSWATATVQINGVNDAPKVQAVSINAVEDGDAIQGSFVGDDVDSDDDSSTLTYTINGTPTGGILTNNGDGSFTYDPDTAYQTLAEGESTSIELSYTATDTHGAVSIPGTLKINVTGTNDRPTLKGSTTTVPADSDGITLDLSTLGDDIDSDNDGSDLVYSLTNAASGGSASITSSTLSFDPGSDFQKLGAGESATVTLGIKATDKHDAEAVNNIEITVTGVNDAPVISGDSDKTGAVTLTPGQAAFKVEQWTAYSGSFGLSNLKSYASSNLPNYVASANVIDYTDDPNGFAGEIPGSFPWPAAAATGATGTTGINNNFFARITSDILITQTDTYTFRTYNDDGVYLKVNNQLIINDPSQHPEMPFEGSIQLSPGTYPVELYFFENGGEASLELTYKNSSGIYQHVAPPEAFDSGVLRFTDVDLSDSHTISVTPLGTTQGALMAAKATDTTGSGTGGIVNWNYQIGNNAYKSLAAGVATVESFMISIDDGKGGVAQQQVDITITGGNKAPKANDDTVVTNEDTAITIGVLANDADPDNGDTKSLVSVTEVQHGTVAISGSDVVYTPAKDYNGSDSFSYTMQDSAGNTSTASVNITVNPINDDPTAHNDTGITLTAANQNDIIQTNNVHWVDWQASTAGATGNATGLIDLGNGNTIEVTYNGEVYFAQTDGGTDFYSGFQGNGVSDAYTSTLVANRPTGSDIIALSQATQKTLTFSEPVDNLFFAIVSLNGNGYLFDRDFQIVSYGTGYWGGGTATRNVMPDGRYEVVGNGELHGVLRIEGTVPSLTWTSQTPETWNGFTVGTYGKAQSSSVSGNLLTNDSDPENDGLTVTEVNGQSIAGNSITLTLASGAKVTVEKDGDFFYDENLAFTTLANGAEATDQFNYKVTDGNGGFGTAIAEITVIGSYIAPV